MKYLKHEGNADVPSTGLEGMRILNVSRITDSISCLRSVYFMLNIALLYNGFLPSTEHVLIRRDRL